MRLIHINTKTREEILKHPIDPNFILEIDQLIEQGFYYILELEDEFDRVRNPPFNGYAAVTVDEVDQQIVPCRDIPVDEPFDYWIPVAWHRDRYAKWPGF